MATNNTVIAEREGDVLNTASEISMIVGDFNEGLHSNANANDPIRLQFDLFHSIYRLLIRFEILHKRSSLISRLLDLFLSV